MPPVHLLLLSVCLLLLLPTPLAHGCMTEPPPRGLLSGKNRFAKHVKPFPGAPTDYYAHFPAGDRDSARGAGKRSQERTARYNWRPFEPMRSGFVWRAGVCGDLKTGRTAGEHLKGGRYYYDAKIVKNYVQGGVIGIRTAIVAHHNGFMEAHVCDVSKCGGDLSEACFRKAGVCKQLLRAGNKVCDSGYSKHCAPIDRKYPGRWYLPCNTRNRGSWMEYMPSYALFRLPAGLTCDKCVLHWYWAGADTCNPPGLREYFEGPDRPRSWGSCVGLGGARGGYARIKTCGARVFPEEYYMCADIRVTSAGGGRSAPPRKEPPVTKAPPSKSKGGKKTYPFVGFRMHVDGRRTGSIFRGRIRRSVGKSSRVAIEAVTKRGVAKVDFFLNGKRVWVDFNRPYFMYGNSGPKPLYGPNLPKRRRFNVMARADGYQIWGNVYLDTR